MKLSLAASILSLTLLAAVAPECASAQAQLVRHVVDDNAGDLKMVGDIDLDGFPDLVLAGFPQEGLNWYRYVAHDQWTKTRIASAVIEHTTDGALGDVDGDGDLDIVAPDGNVGDNLQWRENPRLNAGAPDGDPFVGANWNLHVLGSVGSWVKDVHLADYDHDGRLDIATRRDNPASIFFQTAPGVWSKQTFSGVSLGSEGMAHGDIDQDGDQDLVLRGIWLRNPGAPGDPDKTERARDLAQWTPFTIASSGVDGDFRALVVDLDEDGVVDVLFSSSENTAEIRWHEPTNGDPTAAWTARMIVPSIDDAHTIQVGDMDRDGDLDVVVGQMHTANTPELAIYLNADGMATSWTKQSVNLQDGVWFGIHQGIVADIGADGDMDIVGADWTGHPPLVVWENTTPAPSSDNAGVVAY